MTKVAEHIAQEFRSLPIEEMLALHESLITTIQEREEAAGLDPAFRTDIQRRIREIDSGKVEGVEAFKALEQM